MYTAYWQLSQKPFDHSADAKFYYPSEGHQAALFKLRYAVESRQGAALLAGAGGSGKTLLTQMLPQHLSECCAPVVHLVFPQMPTADLLTYLADELGAPAGDHRQTVEGSVRRIQQFFTDNSGRGRHAVVVLDEAHLLDDPRTLEALRLLLNFEHQGQPQLTLLFVGQPGILSLMSRSHALEERLGARCLLPPLSPEETLSYVSHRLTAAGATRAIFDTDALEAIHETTQGVVRRINRLADLALLVGYADELPALGRPQIEALAHELVAVPG